MVVKSIEKFWKIMPWIYISTNMHLTKKNYQTQTRDKWLPANFWLKFEATFALKRINEFLKNFRTKSNSVSKKFFLKFLLKHHIILIWTPNRAPRITQTHPGKHIVIASQYHGSRSICSLLLSDNGVKMKILLCLILFCQVRCYFHLWFN